jgi:GNAT superfamily N-acetyltransferase
MTRSIPSDRVPSDLKFPDSDRRLSMTGPTISREHESAVQAALRARCHENSIESYRVFARTTPGGRIQEENGLVLVDSLATDSMGNVGVVTTAADDPERLLARAEAFFADSQRPWILFALPGGAASLERTAGAHGLLDEGWFPGLVLDPISPQTPAVPQDVKVHRVGTLEELQEFERTASRAYGVESGPVFGGWLNYPGFSFHLARYRGDPVATATLVASHGVAGVVYVGTVPEARGRGFGQAAVWAAIEEGRSQGYSVCALWATPMGRRMYERMGFRPITQYRIWSPPGFPLPPPFHPR